MSIVYQYENTTVQFSDTQGNIAHQGVLGSNINGSPLLTDFPTTTTGTSLGHYHYTDDTTKALKFLNVSGSGSGGHWFYTANDTTAPVQTARIDIDGITIDTSSGGGNVVYSPPIAQLVDGSHIDFPSGTDLHNAPYNFNQTFNPIYMTQSNGFYITGELAYAFITNGGSQIQIFRNNNNTNPIPPNVVPSDFPNTNTNGLVIGQPVFSLSLPIPAVPKSINLLENLTIVNDTDTSILSATDLTFNSVSLSTTLDVLQIKQTITSNQYISAAITADARPPTAPTTTVAQQYAFTPSWYFKNSFNSNNKINWYLGGDVGMTVADVLGIYMNMFNVSMTSNDLCPFLTIYTTNDTPNPPNFYKSKRTYVFNQNITPVINTRYFMFQNVSGTCPTPFHYGSTLNNMQLSTVSGSNVGAFGATEVILAFAIGSNSAAAINTVEFATNKFGIMTSNGTQEIAFIPS